MGYNFVVKNVLAVHWRGSIITKDSRKLRKQLFKENWMDLDLFQFSVSEDPSYQDWKSTFDEIDFSKYDSIYTNSLWWIMTLKYMFENNLSTKRLVMAVPWISFKTIDWKKPNVNKIYKDFWNPDLSILSEEIIVISAKDDEVVPHQSWKEIADMTNGKYILLEKWWHKLKQHLETIIWLVKNGFDN